MLLILMTNLISGRSFDKLMPREKKPEKESWTKVLAEGMGFEFPEAMAMIWDKVIPYFMIACRNFYLVLLRAQVSAPTAQCSFGH